MMELKKIFLMLMLPLAAAGGSCAYFNPTLVSGEEARVIITERLEERYTLYALYSAATGGSAAQSGILGAGGFIAASSAADALPLEDKTMYKKTEVEDCADKIFAASFGVSALAAGGSCAFSTPPYEIPILTKRL